MVTEFQDQAKIMVVAEYPDNQQSRKVFDVMYVQVNTSINNRETAYRVPRNMNNVGWILEGRIIAIYAKLTTALAFDYDSASNVVMLPVTARAKGSAREYLTILSYADGSLGADVSVTTTAYHKIWEYTIKSGMEMMVGYTYPQTGQPEYAYMYFEQA